MRKETIEMMEIAVECPRCGETVRMTITVGASLVRYTDDQPQLIVANLVGDHAVKHECA